MGLRDTLIEPVSVVAHYEALNDARPDLAHLKVRIIRIIKISYSF